MTCVICKNGSTKKGTTAVTFTKNELVIVFRNVPADICQNCGENYLDEDISKNLLSVANEAYKNGVKVDVRDYIAA